jgi:hypothetical protein
MILPPVTVYSAHLEELRDALEHHLGIVCVKSIQLDETKAYVNFNPTEKTDRLDAFLDSLITGVTFHYNDKKYHVFSQYI